LELSNRVIKACGKSGDFAEWREFVLELDIIIELWMSI